jgi:hypothetical protein
MSILGACNDQLKGRLLDENQSAAINGCLDRVDTEFPNLLSYDVGPASDFMKMGDLDQASISQSGAGDFVFKYPNVAQKARSAILFECKGNLKRRKILSVESQQTSNRPAAGQVWRH